VAATVHAHSGRPLTAVDLVYRQDGGSWQTLAMSASADDSFVAVIPQPGGAVVTDYYIHASDETGREAGMPRTEPAAWYSFDHEGDLSGVPGFGVGDVAVLHGNHPNPFNPATTFSFELLYADEISLDVIDLRGRVVRRLMHGTGAAGLNQIPWDGTDDQGRTVPAGVYLFRLRAAGLQYVRPATLVK